MRQGTVYRDYREVSAPSLPGSIYRGDYAESVILQEETFPFAYSHLNAVYHQLSVMR